MSDNLRVLQVFIASPNDLVEERRAIKAVADSLNVAFGKEVGLQIQLLGWGDTHLAKDRYFYNVVYFLDRALYANLPLRKLFIKEIEAVLD